MEIATPEGPVAPEVARANPIAPAAGHRRGPAFVFSRAGASPATQVTSRRPSADEVAAGGARAQADHADEGDPEEATTVPARVAARFPPSREDHVGQDERGQRGLVQSRGRGGVDRDLARCSGRTATCAGCRCASRTRASRSRARRTAGRRTRKERHQKPGGAPVAEDDRRDQERQEDKRQRPGPPRPPPHHPARVALVGGEVADQLVELGVCLRRQTACDALVELVVVDAAGQMLAAQDSATASRSALPTRSCRSRGPERRL